MEYTSLRKIYYISPDKHDSIYNNRFNSCVANSATVPSILQRLAKWQYLYFDRGNKGISGMQRLDKGIL